MEAADWKKMVRDVPDFPKPGIVFKDITTLLKDAEALRSIIDAMADRYRGKKVDAVVAVEARGFMLGAAIAYRLGAGIVPVRKKGKLPAETYRESYELEYGTDTLEIHRDALDPGSSVLIVDDLLATGGTALATAKLVRDAGGDVLEIVFLIELGFLEGRARLGDLPVFSFIQY